MNVFTLSFSIIVPSTAGHSEGFESDSVEDITAANTEEIIKAKTRTTARITGQFMSPSSQEPPPELSSSPGSAYSSFFGTV